MAKLAVNGLTKRFGTVTAVADLNFALADGELLTLLGPSGCGKTTTLRLIAGFERPTTGEITIDGQSVLHLPPERRHVGFVFQNYALFPHMSVAKNIAYGLRFQHGINRKQRVEELLALVRLSQLARRRPHDLSGGEKQRVALARALAPYPRILLLDEPLSALDAKLREELRQELRHIQRSLHLTTLYVTHDQEEGLAISDRIGVMHAGRIEQLARPTQVYAHPRTAFVAAFIGRVNRLTGTIVDQREEATVVRIADTTLRARTPKVSVIPGRTIQVFIREEDIHIGTGAENQLPGHVIDAEYHGHAWVATCATPIGRLRVRTQSHVAYGDNLTLWFPADRVFLFPAT